MKKLFFVLIAFFSLPIFAAAPSAVLTWTAPTLNTDGTTITGAITYSVYKGATGAETFFTAGITTTATTLAGTPGTTQCFQVTAVVNGVESAKSNEVCKSFPNPVPAAPTGLTVT
jgi:hypothetical protein